MSVSPYMGAPCEWTWEKLEGREVTPPYQPILVSWNEFPCLHAAELLIVEIAGPRVCGKKNLYANLNQPMK